MPADTSPSAQTTVQGGRTPRAGDTRTIAGLADGGLFATERLGGAIVITALAYLIVVRRAWRSVLR